MNCKDAKELIDLLVHDAAEDAREIKTSAQWAELEAHLAGCAKCRGEVEELRRVRRLLAEVSSDRPSDKEIETMWAAIQAPVSVREVFASDKTKGWWVRNRSLVVSLTGAAAVLMLAFLIGNGRYAEQSRRLASVSNMKGVGTSGKLEFDATHMNPTLALSPTSAADFRDGSGEGMRRAGKQGTGGGLGEDARFPRIAAFSDQEFQPPKPARPLESLGYVSGKPTDKAQLRQLGEGQDTPLVYRAGGGQSVSGSEEAQDRIASAPLPPPEIEDAVRSMMGQSRTKNEPGTMAQMQQQRAMAQRQTKWDSRAESMEGREPVKARAIIQPPSIEPEPESGESTKSAAKQGSLKIIKTGELTIEVAVYNGAVERVEKIASQFGAFVADALTKEEAGGALVGRMVIRTSPERFEEVFAALKAVGRVESENVKAADVTAEFVDTEARIHSLKITEERLRELIANKSFVDKIASLLEVERELNRVRTEIEQFEGQLRVMADRIALSTIVLTIREPGRTVPSASLSVEVATLDEASQKLADLLGKTGGRLVSAKTSKRNDGTLMGNFQLETTLAHFAEIVAGIEALGRVQERQVSDQQFGKADENWAQHVKCAIALVLFERSRQLPSGAVRIEVDSLEDATKELSKILQAHEVTIASSQANRQSNGADSADIKLRVPAGHFGAFVDGLGQLGRVLLKAVSGEMDGIVGGAAAVPCELSLTLTEQTREVPSGSVVLEVVDFDSARQSLSKAIAAHNVQVLDSSSNQRPDETWQGSFRLGIPAREMEAFVKAVEALGRVAGRQISGLGLGDLSRADPDSLGVVLLTMSEKSTITPAASEAAGSIRTRVREGLEGFYTSMGLIAYGLVVLLPWLVLAGLIGWIVARLTRRRRMQQETAPAAK